MIEARYNPDWDFMGYYITLPNFDFNNVLDDMCMWAKENQIRGFIQNLGFSSLESPFQVRVPTMELATEFILTFT